MYSPARCVEFCPRRESPCYSLTNVGSLDCHAEVQGATLARTGHPRNGYRDGSVCRAGRAVLLTSLTVAGLARVGRSFAVVLPFSPYSFQEHRCRLVVAPFLPGQGGLGRHEFATKSLRKQRRGQSIHARLRWTFTRPVGRPPLRRETRDLVLRLARERHVETSCSRLLPCATNSASSRFWPRWREALDISKGDDRNG